PAGLKSHCTSDMTHSLNSPTHTASLQLRSPETLPSLCLCVSRLSGMTFARATLEMSHHLILSLIIHLSLQGTLECKGEAARSPESETDGLTIQGE
ncbi:hypothetical protein JOQ06_018342, partial [Pogonophryne albipinna]